MSYKFAQERENYEKYAAGGVFYAAPGSTAFPVRLANEIFNQCLELRQSTPSELCTLYDPCCGSAYLITVVAYFNWHKIGRIFGSDIDDAALALAARNVSLLTVEGVDRRITELSAMVHEFSKSSHVLALENAHILRHDLVKFNEDHPIETHVFHADVTERTTLYKGLGEVKADVVITDIPYGQVSHWQTTHLLEDSGTDPMHQMLESLYDILAPQAVVAVAAPKGSRIAHGWYQRVKKIKLGNRQVVFLKPQPTETRGL